MAVSGSTNWTLDAAEVIEEAYERIGQEARTGYDLTTARRSMNLLLADWANRGVHLWMVAAVTESLTSGTASYTLDDDIIDIMDVVIRRDGTDYLIERISRNEYQNLPVKTITGRPTQYWVDRQSTPVIYLYPAPENSTDQLRFYRTERIEDVTALTNDTDIPSRFIAPLVSGLSYQIAIKKAPERAEALKMIYEEEMARAEMEDRERVSLRLVPSRGLR